MLNTDKIMAYLAETFDGFGNCFLRYTARNVIDYANHNFETLEEQLDFVVTILPEVTLDELRQVITK